MRGKIAVVVVLLLALVGCQKPPPAYESHYTTPTSARPATQPADHSPFNTAAIREALTGPEPYTISVLGDSTGNNLNEWVHLVAQRIANTYGRAVTVHDWKTEEDRYTSEETYGEGAPVTIWNGSGSGKSAQYSLQWFTQMAPDPVNLTIISHSHNDPAQAAQGVAKLVDLAYGHTVPGGGVLVVLQNPRLDAQAQKQQAAVDQLRNIYSNPNTGVVTVDVNAAFRNADLSALLLQDGAHPNDQGEELWADTIWRAF